jgi:hydroxymethylbilane synthase
MNTALGGSCQLPIAALATMTPEGTLHLQGMVSSPDGQVLLKAKASGPPEKMLTIAKQVAVQLLAKGAKKIIANSHI